MTETEGSTCKVIKTFDGPEAVRQAAEYIGTLPDHASGRYGLDACAPGESHNAGCGCPDFFVAPRMGL